MKCNWCGLFSPTSGGGDLGVFLVDVDAFEDGTMHVVLCHVHEREWRDIYGKDGCGLRQPTEEEATILEVMLK